MKSYQHLLPSEFQKKLRREAAQYAREDLTYQRTIDADFTFKDRQEFLDHWAIGDGHDFCKGMLREAGIKPTADATVAAFDLFCEAGFDAV